MEDRRGLAGTITPMDAAKPLTIRVNRLLYRPRAMESQETSINGREFTYGLRPPKYLRVIQHPFEEELEWQVERNTFDRCAILHVVPSDPSRGILGSVTQLPVQESQVRSVSTQSRPFGDQTRVTPE